MATIDYVIVAGYLLTMVFVGVWLQKKASSSIDSYFLGNRSIPWWALGISGMSSNLDVTGTMINVALFFALGVSGFFVEIRGGVTLVLAFLMIFIGKWNRRSEVMTSAEWMHLRFGKGKGGQAARTIRALGSIIFTIALVTYFSKGAGKFVAEFLDFPALWGLPPDFWAAILMITLAMVYTVASGFYGVIWTDVFQSILIFATICMVCYICISKHQLPDKFELSAPVHEEKLKELNEKLPEHEKIKVGSRLGENNKYRLMEKDKKKYVVWETTKQEWTSMTPSNKLDFPSISQYSMFNLFGLLIFFYLVKVIMEGYSGSGGYMAQRYFAAASDREAGLLTVCWTFLLSFRWPFITAIAIMGISLGIKGDPEMVLPAVINSLPTGLKGLLIAGLMAAAMSTFDSTVNAGAAFWVRDIYQQYINPQASENTLLRQSRISSIVMVIIALLLSLFVKNINDIWGLITMGLSAGMFIPLMVRWYWWRFNGWGFAFGSGVGILVAIAQKLMLPVGTPEYISFSIVVVSSLVATILATFMTNPTEEEVLDNFYRKTRPFGFWKPIKSRLQANVITQIDKENKRDFLATFIAVPWQLVLFLTWMMIMLTRWDQMIICAVALVILSVALYFMWYRHLSNEVEM